MMSASRALSSTVTSSMSPLLFRHCEFVIDLEGRVWQRFLLLDGYDGREIRTTESARHCVEDDGWYIWWSAVQLSEATPLGLYAHCALASRAPQRRGQRSAFQ